MFYVEYGISHSFEYRFCQINCNLRFLQYNDYKNILLFAICFHFFHFFMIKISCLRKKAITEKTLQNLLHDGDRKIAPRKNAPQQILPWVRVRDRVRAANITGDNLPGGAILLVPFMTKPFRHIKI